MLTYQDCINLTQKRNRRKLKNNTYLIKSGFVLKGLPDLNTELWVKYDNE